MVRKTLQAHENKRKANLIARQKEFVIIYFRYPYYEDKCLQLLKSCIRKIKENYKINQLVGGLLQHQRIEFILSINLVVYKFTCPGCGSNYVGKTERTLYERCVEHA